MERTEKDTLEFWEKEQIYKFDQKSKKKTYAIDTPPPTVSGEMHIGHAFSYSQQDFIARFKRMQGFNVFYPFGTDDNGIPTEKLIQKLKQVKSKEMSREDFIDLCLKTLKEISPAFVQDWKNLGISCDYDLLYSTLDSKSRAISQKSFIELYKRGLVYKKEFPTIWDTEFQTPVAQAELEDKEKESIFYTLKFKAEKELHIATTRPEMLAACLAIFVNPKDKRYKSLVGKKAQVPLFNHSVPIIADDSADMEKGTGALMVCSYGDKYDVDAITRHKLVPKIIINKDGTMNIPNYQGLYVKEARKKIVEQLKEANLVLDEKKIKHIANVYEKSGREIEFIPTDTWFIKILDKKQKLIEQGKKITWHPEHMRKRYENWIHGLDWDWSISRERHFGVPIPAWHCEKCDQVLLAEESELPVDPMQVKKKCPKCKSLARPDEKVLDTWATSSLSPQITSSLVKGKVKLPFDLRPQGHDIIRTWAFYTIVKSLYHSNSIPWKNINISGFVTLGGEKMGKSKGNVIKPQDSLTQYGADALRYWASSSKLGENVDYQEKDLVTGKKFVTKIKNAANFTFQNLVLNEKAKLEETDRLFLVQLNELIKTSTEAFESFNYSKAKLETDMFFWKTFADNYLELVKYRVYQGSSAEKESAYYALYHAFLVILKLMAPITPFVTEEIYQEHFRKREKVKSIHNSSWPEQFKIKKDKSDDQVWNKLIELVSLVRQAKSKAQKSMKAPISLVLPKEDQKLIAKVMEDFKKVTCTQEISDGDFKVNFL